MRRFISTAVVMWAASMIAGSASAQHFHRHGDHFDMHENVEHGHDEAGHLTDEFGHHIDGDGRHTGRIGVFEDGSYDNGWNNYPSFNNYPSNNYPSFQPGYVPPTYPSVQNGYVTPNYPTPNALPSNTGVTRPLGSSTVVNKIPVPGVNQIPGVGSQAGGGIALRNPSDSGGAIGYTLNNYSYTIKPGEIQRLQADRTWVIKFDNGLGKQITYRLESGNYDFTVNPQSGWDVGRRSVEAQNAAPQPDLPPSLPLNAIPQSPPPSPPATTGS